MEQANFATQTLKDTKTTVSDILKATLLGAYCEKMVVTKMTGRLMTGVSSLTGVSPYFDQSLHTERLQKTTTTTSSEVVGLMQ